MKVIISNTAGEPLYEQIKSQIKSQIISGDLHVGLMIPSMRALAKDLEVSVITTKRAYDDLEREGFVYTIPGKGTFIARQNSEVLNERKLKLVEDRLADAVKTARLYGVSDGDVHELLTLLLEGK